MHPRLLRLAGRLLWFYQRSGLEWLARKVGFMKLLPDDLRRLEPQTPRMVSKFSPQLISEHEAPAQPAKYRVALLTGCMQDLMFSDLNRDTADVLLANNCSVHTPSVQPCCGSLHSHNGEPGLASILARQMINLLPPDEYDAIITNAGGCGSHLRHYSLLLGDDPDYTEKARLWDSKIKDIHEWLAEIGCRTPSSSPLSDDSNITVTYHDSCHLAHGQKVVKQPRDILKSIPGLIVKELPESNWCCGSAGVYSITQPAQATLLLNRKIGHIKSTGATVLATANPGCHLQIARGLEEAGQKVAVVHPISLLAKAYRAEANSEKLTPTKTL